MKIQNMFQKDIERDINGVVKVAQNDENSLKQELSEYIITRELRRHFNTFFENYSRAIDRPTDKIGVWISGFFGSGKSHFLKMLSYLLSNQEVCGKKVIDYFSDKFDDPMMLAQAIKCASVPTESILFNIDIVGPINKDKTAVLRVFAKMFYNHCGFYGDDLKIAKLERFIEKQGKTQEFRDAFEEVNGAPWIDSRDVFAFFEDDVVEVLQSVLGMSEQAARNWFNGEETNELSIEQLVADIREYIEKKGKNFRLLFMVDEVGQYIGDDGDLMINLQSLVEEIGTQCRGQVWVMVTSQEAIDSVVKISGDDFSKIQGRFNTRLSLSSSSVDEVIKKRILGKTYEAEMLLRMVYDKQHAVLKNLYTFNNPVKDIKGFTNGEEFAASFPLVPYQFIILQKVMTEIRKHGNSGKHFSGAERSMLSASQEATQKMKDKDENALVPFYLFYDTLLTFLESPIRRVIDRCQTAADNRDGLEQDDVCVLKTLYLIRYIEDIKANVDNIAILMIDDIHTDKIALRNRIFASLERLLSQNYVSRNGDTYAFLTDEEQDVAIDIKNTVVDSSNIIRGIAETVYGDIYPSKRYTYGKYVLPYDQYIDEMLNGAGTGGMRLRLVTVVSDYFTAPIQRLIMDSKVNNEAIVILSNETPYFDELEQAAKIKKYVNNHNVSQMSESMQDIVRKYQSLARTLEKRARGYIEQAIVDARVIVHGEIMDIKTTSAKEKLEVVMRSLTESVYSKIGMVNRFVESDADIIAILNGSEDDAMMIVGSGANNEDALNEIGQWLEMKQGALSVTMGDVQRRYSAIPYGWREIDIAALIARLISKQKVVIKYGGVIVGKTERRLVDYLRKKNEIDRAVVTRKVSAPEELLRKSVAFLRDYLSAMDIPGDEDNLVLYIVDTFERKLSHYEDLLTRFYAQGKYPEKDVVTGARDLMKNILSQQKDNVALLNRMLQKQDDLLDSLEDCENIEFFFKSQYTVYDEARYQMDTIIPEQDYFSADLAAQDTFRIITEILMMAKPYHRIGELPELISAVKQAYKQQLDEKHRVVNDHINQCQQDVYQIGHQVKDAAQLLRSSDSFFEGKYQAMKQATSLTQLDAMITQCNTHRDVTCKRLVSMLDAQNRKPDDTKPNDPRPRKIKIANVRRNDMCAVKRLNSKADIDAYVEELRQKLNSYLDGNDGIQIT